jgi:hypothetical protein
LAGLMLARVQRWIWELLVSIDQLLHVILGGPKYLLVGGPVPSADETISSKVGRRSIAGERWAIVVEKIIDGIFYVLTGQSQHCLKSIGH